VVVLDEWKGLPEGHPATCAVYDDERISGPLGVPASRRQRWRGAARNPAAEIRRMTRWLARKGPIDLCILGLGRNGHLLMNEPAPFLSAGPHLGRLAAQTRRHPTLRAARPTPRFGYCLGLADILAAREVLLLVSGRSKVAALRRTLAGRVDPRCPASFLWLHPNATVYCDREAAGTRR
jgi:galactosamine-6-phosphate isomerase